MIKTLALIPPVGVPRPTYSSTTSSKSLLRLDEGFRRVNHSTFFGVMRATFRDRVRRREEGILGVYEFKSFSRLLTRYVSGEWEGPTKTVYLVMHYRLIHFWLIHVLNSYHNMVWVYIIWYEFSTWLSQKRISQGSKIAYSFVIGDKNIVW